MSEAESEGAEQAGSDEIFNSIMAVGGGFIIAGIIGAVLVPSDPAGGFLFLGGIGLVIGWMYGTDSGKEFREEIAEQQQQQQLSGSSKPKVICQECGWQNPKGNNYCHDCGAELTANNASPD